jgi:hypothetical protein
MNKTIKKIIANSYTLDDINYAFGGVHALNDEQWGKFLRAVNILSNDLIDIIADEIYFTSCDKATLGWHVPLNATHLRNKKCIVFLPERLFELNPKKIRTTILHEIAHHILKHKCMFDITGKEKILKQERDANRLVKKWITQSR